MMQGRGDNEGEEQMGLVHTIHKIVGGQEEEAKEADCVWCYGNIEMTNNEKYRCLRGMWYQLRMYDINNGR